MIIQQGTILQEGKFQQKSIQFQQDITAIPENTLPVPEEGEEVINAKDCYVVPGLIDLHTHGAMGKDASDGIVEDLDTLSSYYASVGVTAFCPTTMTLQEPQLTAAVKALATYKTPVGAKSLGVYLEGPFFHYDKRGAQSAKNLATPDIEFFHRLLALGDIAVLSLAPELEGAMDLIADAKQHCTVALGHSTADYDCAMKAYATGASLSTHLFNGMMPFAHRTPGIIGAALDSDAYGELICDGLHIHPSVIRASFRLFGKKLCLISDSLRCAGMVDGEYELGGQKIFKKGSVARLADGTLAGSSVGLLESVRNCISFGIPPEDAFYAGSTAPAMAIGKENRVGSLDVGKSADFLLLDKEYRLLATFVNGKIVVDNR